MLDCFDDIFHIKLWLLCLFIKFVIRCKVMIIIITVLDRCNLFSMLLLSSSPLSLSTESSLFFFRCKSKHFQKLIRFPLRYEQQQQQKIASIESAKSHRRSYKLHHPFHQCLSFDIKWFISDIFSVSDYIHQTQPKLFTQKKNK